MKTNVIMTRPMGDFQVEQRTNDSMFNATSLIKQWQKFSGQKKTIDHFFDNKGSQEFIDALQVEENINTRNSVYLKTRGKNGATWMHPILFVKFAMWLNPSFEVKVIKFIYDELIKHRHIAGDNYKRLTASAAKLKNVSYPDIAKALNYVVFGKHHKDIRNTATPEQLSDLYELEEKMAFAIDMEYIKTFDGLLESLRTIWYQRNRKF